MLPTNDCTTACRGGAGGGDKSHLLRGLALGRSFLWMGEILKNENSDADATHEDGKGKENMMGKKRNESTDAIYSSLCLNRTNDRENEIRALLTLN